MIMKFVNNELAYSFEYNLLEHIMEQTYVEVNQMYSC